MANIEAAASPHKALPVRPFTLRQFNRKDRAPSNIMLGSEGFHHRCSWIEDSITVHSDGNVSCGLDDPHSNRSFGNINSQSIEEIFRNPEYERLQSKLGAGYRCHDCTLYHRETTEFSGAHNRLRLPSTLIIEPTVICNIRCLNGTACAANNDPTIRTRDANSLSFEAFVSIIDQLRHTLKHVYFFNYGDPFVHARAEDMLIYLRQTCPGVQVVTSTNGIPLYKPERAMRVVESRVNLITFTIGGITQESYSRYHVNGNVEKALLGLKNVVDAKVKLGVREPKVVWRYLLFRWNDSDDEIKEAVRLAKSYGVDQFILYLTPIPFEGTSFRFAPSTPNFIRYRDIIDSALHYTKVAGIPEPGADGFYLLEDNAELGLYRWTGWRASQRFDPKAKWIHLTLTTNRPSARNIKTCVYLVTPWKTFKIPLKYMQWKDVTLRVPPLFDGVPEIKIIAPDYWFPAEETGSRDPRCLGVIIKADGEEVGVTKAWRRWLRTSNLPPMTKADSARLAELDLPAPASLPDSNAGRFSFDEFD